MTWLLISVFVLWSVAYVAAHHYLHHTYPYSLWFERIEPVEQFLWRHSKTILAARLVTLVSVIVSLHDTIAPALVGFDWTPLLPAQYVQYVPLVGVLLGLLFELLRNLTDQSLPDKREELKEATAISVGEGK